MKDYISPLGLPREDLAEIESLLDESLERFRGKTILLTGATGFIGKWLLGSFLYLNVKNSLQSKIVCTTRNKQKFLARFPDLICPETIHWIEGDISELKIPEQFTIDFVVHAATDVENSPGPESIFKTIVKGTERVIQELKRMPSVSFLNLSSGAVYGSSFGGMPLGENGPCNLSTLNVSSAYGEGKRVSELLCALEENASKGRFRVCNARCFAFVGPHLPLDKHFAIGNFINSALKNESVDIKGDGTPLRTYLYSADLAAYLWFLVLNCEGAETYNVGGGEVVSIAQLAERVLSVANCDTDVKIHTKANARAPVSSYIPDLTLLRNKMGGKYRSIGIEDSIKRTISWHRSRKEVR